MWGIIFGGLITIGASFVFSRKATAELKRTTRILAGYLEGTINGQDIRFNRDRHGNITGLNYTLHVEPGNYQIQSSDEVKLTVAKNQKGPRD
jgi:hypothetical protein